MYENMIAITNRHLCDEFSYFEQLQFIASLHPKAIVLREKDLSPEEYEELAGKAIEICNNENVMLILHNFYDVAIKCNHPFIHLPLHILSELDKQKSSFFKIKGTSVHSVEDMLLAQKLGADYTFAGNIYETDCKKGLAGRGLDFLKSVVEIADFPVYAIGGITAARMPEILQAGAAGGCMMSGFMKMTP